MKANPIGRYLFTSINRRLNNEKDNINKKNPFIKIFSNTGSSGIQSTIFKYLDIKSIAYFLLVSRWIERTFYNSNYEISNKDLYNLEIKKANFEMSKKAREININKEEKEKIHVPIHEIKLPNLLPHTWVESNFVKNIGKNNNKFIVFQQKNNPREDIQDKSIQAVKIHLFDQEKREELLVNEGDKESRLVFCYSTLKLVDFKSIQMDHLHPSKIIRSRQETLLKVMNSNKDFGKSIYLSLKKKDKALKALSDGKERAKYIVLENAVRKNDLLEIFGKYKKHSKNSACSTWGFLKKYYLDELRLVSFKKKYKIEDLTKEIEKHFSKLEKIHAAAIKKSGKIADLLIKKSENKTDLFVETELFFRKYYNDVENVWFMSSGANKSGAESKGSRSWLEWIKSNPNYGDDFENYLEKNKSEISYGILDRIKLENEYIGVAKFARDWILKKDEDKINSLLKTSSLKSKIVRKIHRRSSEDRVKKRKKTSRKIDAAICVGNLLMASSSSSSGDEDSSEMTSSQEEEYKIKYSNKVDKIVLQLKEDLKNTSKETVELVKEESRKRKRK